LIRLPLRFSAQTQGWGIPKTEGTKDKGTLSRALVFWEEKKRLLWEST
jgi:hypothetical protein